MASVLKTIGGKEVECFEVGNTGKMLLQLTGAFEEDSVRNTFMLVPLTMEEPQLEHLCDLWLNEQEQALGLPIGNSCTSSGWWVGSNEKTWLEEITDQYDHLIPAAEKGLVPVYGYEVGVLLDKDHAEYKQYSVVNPELPYGFYDKGQGLFQTGELAKVLEAMHAYAKTGAEKTYAIISKQGYVSPSEAAELADSEEACIRYEHFKEPFSVLYSVCKIGNEIREGFLEDLIKDPRVMRANADKLLTCGACGDSFYAIQHHERTDSASFFSLYVVDRQPASMDKASIDNFMYANRDRGWSSAGSWDQVMSEFRDFVMDMNGLRHTVEQEKMDDAKLPVHQVTLIRERYSDDEIWSDVFWVDALKTPAKELFVAAVEEFLSTPDGRQAIEDTCEDFNWGDAVMYVPEEIWNKHGIYSDIRDLTPNQRSLAPTSSDMSVTIKVDQDEILIPDAYYHKDAERQPLDNIIQSASRRTGNPTQDNKSNPDRDR